MDKQVGVYPYNGILLSNKDKLLIPTILKNLKTILNERSHAKKENILYDSREDTS